MNKKQIGILLIAAMGMALAVAAAQPTPFLIAGWVFDANGEPCNDPSIEITNTNTSESWDAETYRDTNYYQLVINSTNVNAKHRLQLITTCGGSSNISNQTLTKNEISAGGLFDFNITLEEGIWVQPDLVVSGIEVHVLNNSVNATIENIGIAPITEQFNVSFSVNETTIGTKTIPRLDAGNNTTVAFEWLLPQAGEYKLCINADADDEIRESNESNNEYMTNVTIPEIRVIVAIKDVNETMHIQELFLPQNAESMALHVTEKACDALNILFNYDGGNVTIDGLVEPAIFLYNRSLNNWSRIPLNRYLANGDIIGWSGTGGFTAVQPDLIPGDIGVTSFGSVLYPNTTNRIEVTIENIGILDVSNFTCVLKADNETVDEVEIERLNAMNNINVSFVWMPNRTGDYLLAVEVDSKDDISESNEANNIITKNVTVKLPPAVVHVSSIEELQDVIDFSPVVVANHGWMTIYLDEGVYEKIVDLPEQWKHIEVIALKGKRNLTIAGENKNAIISIKAATIGTNEDFPGAEVISISNSTNLELRGFTVEVLEKKKDNHVQNVRNVAIQDSNNITLTNLTLYHGGHIADGKNVVIKIENSKYCSISSNVIHGLGAEAWSPSLIEQWGANTGIKLWQSENNLVYCNTIYNLAKGIDLGGNNNTIYLNNLFAMTKNALCSGYCNHWNSTTLINYTYNGTTRENYTGNYWDDYNGTDNNNNSDGIEDVPYGIEGDAGAFDYHPLMEPHELTFDLIVRGLTRPSIIYANRTNTIFASVERTGTSPLPVQICANLTANGEVKDSKTIVINNSEHKVVRFGWNPQNTGNYHLEVSVGAEELIEAVKEKNVENNNLSIDMSISSAFYNYSTNITSALDFLSTNKSLLNTGSISGFSNSGWAALGITAAGEDPASGRWKHPWGPSLISYLRNNPKDEVIYFPPGSNPSCLSSLEDIARMVMVISATGEDPTNYGGVNYLVVLKSYYDGEQFGYPDTLRDGALAILALVACGEGNCEMVKDTVDHIRQNQNSDGGWSDFGDKSSVEVTSLMIQALAAAGEDPSTYTNNGTTPLDYLKNAQEDDGGFSNVRVTSFTIQAIVAAGDNPLTYTNNGGNNPLEYLLSLQQEDGSFNYTPDMSFFPPVSTTYPISALCGIPHPVMIRTLGNEYSYEVPDVSVRQIAIEDEICVNTSYTVSADVRCNGGIFDVNLSSDEGLIQRGEVNSVWHESLSTVSFTWKPNHNGTFNLTVFADSNDRIEELTDVNNNLTEQVEVVYPDLYPFRITPPDRTYVNVTNVINCTIRGTTDEHFNVTLLEADGEPVGKQRIEGIRDNATISFEWRPSANRTYNLRFTVDSDEEVQERDEDNNTVERSVTVLLPDLIPTSITADEVFVNARNKVNVTVEGMAESFNVSLIENGTVVGKTANVTCYGKENVTVYWKPASLGNHTITAFVDSDRWIKETNEGNNNITDTFEVLLPDLVPEDIAPDVLYIDEVNAITVEVNGTAEGFNATLVANEIIDKSGPLCYKITPIFNETFGKYEVFLGTSADSNLTFNITEQRTNWSWEDIDTLDVFIASNTSKGLVDSGDAWSVDYVAVVVDYTLNSTNQTLELNASSVVSGGNWSNGNNTYISDDEYATTTESTTLHLRIRDTDAIYGNITSVVIKVEQHVVDAVPSKKDTTLKKSNLDTYNGSIAFEWLPMKLGEYKLTVFLDSDDDVVETNETNNNMTKSVVVAKRIDLELTSPVGGETWEGIQNIIWNATYEKPLLIDLYYSPDRGYRWINITTNETNDGSYAWNTEDVIDGEYMIKIIARTGMVTEEDQSDIFYVRNRKAGMEWGSFHANAGYAPCDAPDTNEIAWVSDDIGAEGSSSLIVARGKIFVYCAGWQGMYSDYTYLVALDESDGEILWGTPIAPRGYGSWATPAYKDRSIFVSSGGSFRHDGRVYRIEADTGKIEWEFEFPGGYGSVNGGPAVTSRAVYVGDWDGGNYYCFDTATGKEIYWVFDVTEGGDGRAQSVPAIAYGNVYIGSFAYYKGQSNAYCVDAFTGTKIWNTPIGAVCGSITVSDRVVYFTTYTGAEHFYALDALNGTKIWDASIGWTDSTPAYYAPSKSVRSYIYVATNDRVIYCFDAETGEWIWQVLGLGGWTNSPVVTKDGKVFVGKEGGGGLVPGYSGLYCLDALTGKELWHSEHGGSSPVVVNGFVYTIGSGRVFVFGNGTMPDLTVKANATDGRYVVGKKGNITATIENIGKSNVTESFKVELRHKGDVTAEQTVQPPLNINNSREVVFEWTPENPGEHRLTVEVDPPPGNVTESNPWNNIANVTVYVEDNKPDLVSFIEAQDTAFVGELVPVNVTIENEGYETNESFFVKFFDEGYNPPEERLISLDGNEPKSLDFTWTAPDENGTYNLMVSVNNNNNSEIRIMNEQTWTNNQNSTKVEVMPTPTPTPTPTPENPCYGPGSRGGYGGGSAGGIGAGSGIGEAGAGEAGGMQIPVNASDSADEKKKEVFGFPFGNASSGASGGGGTLPLLLIALIVLTFALFYFGYYKEKRAYRGDKK